jgi:hypothetical protein
LQHPLLEPPLQFLLYTLYMPLPSAIVIRMLSSPSSSVAASHRPACSAPEAIIDSGSAPDASVA